MKKNKKKRQINHENDEEDFDNKRNKRQRNKNYEDEIEEIEFIEDFHNKLLSKGKLVLEDEPLQFLDEDAEDEMLFKRQQKLYISDKLKNYRPILPKKLNEVKVPKHNMEEVFKDFKFKEQTRLCENSMKHDNEAKEICKNIMRFIEHPKNCISFVADWFRNRIFPDLSEKNETLFLMIHVIFTPVLFSISSSDGFIFFDSFDRMSDLLQLQKYMSKTYSIIKERFAIRSIMIENNEKCNDCIILLQQSNCLDKPKLDTSGKQSEMSNFAHNDFLHHYSGNFRSNIILSIIYYKLRLNIGNHDNFRIYQMMFFDILSYINYLLYTCKDIYCVPKEVVELIGNLISEVNNIDFYDILNNNLHQYYKEKEKQDRKIILEYCEEKLPELKNAEISILI